MHNLENTNVIEYLKYGEKLEVEVTRGSNKGRRMLPQLESVGAHKPYWYSLPQFDLPPIIFQYLIDIKARCFWNRVGATAADVFFFINPIKKSDTLIILAYLNSTLAAMLIELYGRSYGGILKIQVYELEQLPILNPELLSESERAILAKKFQELAHAIDKRMIMEDALNAVKSKSKISRGLFEDQYKLDLGKAVDEESRAQEALDKSIFDILGFSENERKQVKESLSELQELRRLRTEL
jgi:hypothetical protein